MHRKDWGEFKEEWFTMNQCKRICLPLICSCYRSSNLAFVIHGEQCCPTVLLGPWDQCKVKNKPTAEKEMVINRDEPSLFRARQIGAERWNIVWMDSACFLLSSLFCSISDIQRCLYIHSVTQVVMMGKIQTGVRNSWGNTQRISSSA